MRGAIEDLIKTFARNPWYLIPIAIIFIPLFYHLGAHCIYMWDEAIYANNALEMLYHRNWFVIQNNGVPSHYNVKPQLVTWLQAFSMSLFGVKEWALRLPSALAGFGIILLLLIFSKRWIGNYLVGLFGGIILVSAFGFVRIHMTRSGDLDAVMLFFVTGYVFTFLDYLLSKDSVRKYLLLLTGLIVCAFMSKSLAGLMPLIPLGVLSVFFARGRAFLFDRRTWLHIAVGLSLIGIYYFARNLVQPEYFQMVWDSEFLRFTHNVMPWHKQPFTFYIRNFTRLDFFDPHIYVFGISAVILIISKDMRIRLISSLLIGFCVLYLLLISIPVVKLEWYDAPFYPFACFLIAIAIWKYTSQNGICWVILLLTILFPYRSVLTYYTDRIYPTEPLEKEGDR